MISREAALIHLWQAQVIKAKHDGGLPLEVQVEYIETSIRYTIIRAVFLSKSPAPAENEKPLSFLRHSRHTYNDVIWRERDEWIHKKWKDAVLNRESLRSSSILCLRHTRENLQSSPKTKSMSKCRPCSFAKKRKIRRLAKMKIIVCDNLHALLISSSWVSSFHDRFPTLSLQNRCTSFWISEERSSVIRHHFNVDLFVQLLDFLLIHH